MRPNQLFRKSLTQTIAPQFMQPIGERGKMNQEYRNYYDNDYRTLLFDSNRNIVGIREGEIVDYRNDEVLVRRKNGTYEIRDRITYEYKSEAAISNVGNYVGTFMDDNTILFTNYSYNNSSTPTVIRWSKVGGNWTYFDGSTTQAEFNVFYEQSNSNNNHRVSEPIYVPAKGHYVIFLRHQYSTGNNGTKDQVRSRMIFFDNNLNITKNISCPNEGGSLIPPKPILYNSIGDGSDYMIFNVPNGYVYAYNIDDFINELRNPDEFINDTVRAFGNIGNGSLLIRENGYLDNFILGELPSTSDNNFEDNDLYKFKLERIERDFPDNGSYYYTNGYQEYDVDYDNENRRYNRTNYVSLYNNKIYDKYHKQGDNIFYVSNGWNYYINIFNTSTKKHVTSYTYPTDMTNSVEPFMTIVPCNSNNTINLT